MYVRPTRPASALFGLKKDIKSLFLASIASTFVVETGQS